MSQRFRFDSYMFGCTLTLLCVEVGIALCGGGMPWVRGFVGDVLAVVLVYCSIRSFSLLEHRTAAVVALLIAVGLEGVQLLNRLMGWHIHNRILRILIGATPDWFDILAYGIGFSICLLSIQRQRR